MKGYEKILINDIVNIMNITDVLTGDQMYYLFNRDNFNKNWAKAQVLKNKRTYNGQEFSQDHLPYTELNTSFNQEEET